MYIYIYVLYIYIYIYAHIYVYTHMHRLCRAVFSHCVVGVISLARCFRCLSVAAACPI